MQEQKQMIDGLDMSVVEQIAEHYKSILTLIGEDPERDGLKKTPMRAAKALSFLTSGYRKDPKKVVNSAIFEYSGSKMVIVKGIEFYSLCEHHILPFYGEISIGYVPGDGMVGLSKVARIVDVFARRLQVQERLTREVCDVLYKELGAKGVIVYCEADHMCMKMRGVEKENSSTATIEYCGVFDDAAMRQEFFSLLQGYKK